MRQTLALVCFIVVATLTIGCSGYSDMKDGAAGDSGNADFDQTMSVADSLFNCMQFRDAYDLYLQLLNNPVAEADSEKKLNLLSSISNASELSGHKAEETKWLQQQLDLAKETGNSYFHAMALVSMGQNIFFEGDRAKGIQYVNEAIDLIAKTDRGNTDHLTHGFLNLLASLYSEMKDYDSALLTCERNLQLTMQGTRWGAAQNQQLIDRRMALAKKAALLARMGINSSGSKQSAYFQRADSAYAAWKAVEYEGNHTRDYFIVDYMKRRGLLREAAAIYAGLIERVRLHGDTLGEMMRTAKWGLADVCHQMGNSEQAATLYEEVLEIRDTLMSRKARNTAQELAAIYHAKEQEQTIMQQEAENTRQRYILFSVIAVLLAIAALAVTVAVKNRSIRRKNRILAQQIADALKYKEIAHQAAAPMPQDTKQMTDEELYHYIRDTIIREHLFTAPDFGRDTIMNRFNLSKERVGAIFSSVGQYAKMSSHIQQMRLDYGARLLVENPDMSISEVASRCGFSRGTYFSTSFRQCFGMSPSDYRRNAMEREAG